MSILFKLLQVEYAYVLLKVFICSYVLIISPPHNRNIIYHSETKSPLVIRADLEKYTDET